MVGVALKVTDVPEAMVVAEAAMLTDGVTLRNVMFKVLLFTTRENEQDVGKAEITQ